MGIGFDLYIYIYLFSYIHRSNRSKNWVVVSNTFLFSPRKFGEDKQTHFNEHIFQNGLVQPPTRKTCEWVQ